MTLKTTLIVAGLAASAATGALAQDMKYWVENTPDFGAQAVYLMTAMKPRMTTRA